jgi:hypothetical protein
MKPLRATLLAALVLMTGKGTSAAEKLDIASVRNFVTAQNRAWSARDFARYYGTFNPGAEIVTIRTAPDGKVTRTVRSPAEDRKEAKRFFASTQAIIRETDYIEKIEISPDSRHARVRVREETGILENGRSRLLHAITEEDVGLRNGRIVALGLTERR